MSQNSKLRFLPPVLAALAITALIIVVLEATPRLDGPTVWGQGVRSSSGDGWLKIEEFDHGQSFSAKLEGEVDFDEEETKIESLSRGGRLVLEETRSDHRYRLEVDAGDGGEPSYEWSVDGDRREFDAEARSWLAEAVPRFLRLSGIHAEERAERILARGGVSAVLDEVELIRSDSGQTRYLAHLLEKTDLSSGELTRALGIAAEELGTDSDMAEFLELIDAESLGDPVVRRPFVDAVESIGTDSTMGPALSRLFADPALVPEARRELLEVSTSIGTDSELAEVLKVVVRSSVAEDELPRAFYDAARSIGTDSELAEVLLVLAEAQAPGNELPRSFFETVGSIGTDSEHRRVLEGVVARSHLSTNEIRALLTSARGIGTDSELAQLLIGLLDHHDLDGELEDEFRATLETVGSRSERERVLRAWQA